MFRVVFALRPIIINKALSVQSSSCLLLQKRLFSNFFITSVQPNSGALFGSISRRSLSKEANVNSSHKLSQPEPVTSIDTKIVAKDSRGIEGDSQKDHSRTFGSAGSKQTSKPIDNNVQSDPIDNDTVFIPKINIRFKSYEHHVLSSYAEFIKRAAHENGVIASGCWPLPTHVARWTVLRSPHVHKKHRDKLERRTYNRLIQLRNVTGATADTFISYLIQMVPPGVEVKVTQTTLEKLPAEITTVTPTRWINPIPSKKFPQAGVKATQ